MTIYVDVSAAVHGKAGLSRYVASLVAALEPLLGERLSVFQNSLGRRGPLDGWPESRVAGVPWGYKPWRALVLARTLANWPMRGLLDGAELFHATEHLLPPLAQVPAILTVHDLIFERYPSYHKRYNCLYLQKAMPIFCREAQRIIAPSLHTKQDLGECYGIDPAKVRVIPEAAAPHFVPQPPERVAEVREQYSLPERYALAVGTLEPRKNLTRLIEACGPLFHADHLDGLVLVGSRGWLYEAFFEYLASSPWRERVIMPGFVADADLPAVYAGAAVTVQPSLYEGFGLPVLEAMACGSPVCASRSSSLPEVGGEAAIYFEPTDVDAMSEALHTVVTNAERQQAMRTAGLARSRQFTWEETARQTLALYEELVD
jgi:glycosyltransferase involved in cell wall biosynthesis